jgi:hypothetical protein
MAKPQAEVKEVHQAPLRWDQMTQKLLASQGQYGDMPCNSKSLLANVRLQTEKRKQRLFVI